METIRMHAGQIRLARKHSRHGCDDGERAGRIDSVRRRDVILGSIDDVYCLWGHLEASGQQRMSQSIDRWAHDIRATANGVCALL